MSFFAQCGIINRVVRFHPFVLIPRVLQKAYREKATLLLITPAWQTKAWYPKAIQMSIMYKKPNLNSKNQKPSFESQSRGPPSCPERLSTASCLDHFRVKLFVEGLSEKNCLSYLRCQEKSHNVSLQIVLGKVE